MKTQPHKTANSNTETAVIGLLLSVLATVLSDEFPNLKPRMLDRLYRLQKVPRNAQRLATIDEAIHRVEHLR